MIIRAVAPLRTNKAAIDIVELVQRAARDRSWAGKRKGSRSEPSLASPPRAEKREN
jgi:hypothetical protein